MPAVSKGNLITLLSLLTLFAGCGSGSEENIEPEVPTAQGVQEPPPATAELKLNLQRGDRFPLVKNVEQVLIQPSDQGMTEVRSRLELLLELHVEDVNQAGQKLLSVKYHRVNFQHNLGGEIMEYNSARPSSAPLPLEVQAYFGLVNNGFSFWLGPDNRIVQTLGFREFLQRCVSSIPAEHRERLYAQMEASAGNDGIANFVDDSIGLLPYSTTDQPASVKINDGWTRKRQISGPVPMNLETNFLLKKIDAHVAEVDIVGRILPAPSTAAPQGKELQLTLLSGESLGHCTLDLETGLPRKSEVLQTMELKVELAGGNSFIQKKRISTTLETYPEPLNSQPLQIGNPAASNQPLRRSQAVNSN